MAQIAELLRPPHWKGVRALAEGLGDVSLKAIAVCLLRRRDWSNFPNGRRQM